jgi:glucosamine--fructose-6-phosphate aminotransferase (isomerizing)
MCGIVGAVAQRNVVPILLEGLRRLEYRGYDSAGLAVINNGLHRVRSVGRVAELSAEAGRQHTHGHLGIAHTRWATHGAPTQENAHPHVSSDEIAVVHNGIIENHEALRERLKSLGYAFTSQTDTEVIVHLIHHYYHASRDMLAAVGQAVGELHGAFAIGVVCADAPHQLVAARRGSPLLIGLGIEENFIASDVSALLPVTQKVIYLRREILPMGFIYNIFDIRQPSGFHVRVSAAWRNEPSFHAGKYSSPGQSPIHCWLPRVMTAYLQPFSARMRRIY